MIQDDNKDSLNAIPEAKDERTPAERVSDLADECVSLVREMRKKIDEYVKKR